MAGYTLEQSQPSLLTLVDVSALAKKLNLTRQRVEYWQKKGFPEMAID